MRRFVRSMMALAVLAGALFGAAPASAGLVPVAVNDAYSAVHGKLRTVAAPGVLGNDLQLGGGFTVALTNDVDHGTLDLDADGGFTYRSDADYIGPDTFRYRVNGGLLGLSNVATVTIAVTNDAPTAAPDAYTAVTHVQKTIAPPGILANDDDDDGDALIIDVVQEPANGNLNEDPDGGFRYKADRDFSGTDTWRYRVSDGFAWSNTTTVTMTVSAPRATPTATPTPSPTPTPTPPSVATVPPGPTLPPAPTLPPISVPTPSVSIPGSTAIPSPAPTAQASPGDPAGPSPTAGGPGASTPSGPGGPGGPVSTPAGGNPSPRPDDLGTPRREPIEVTGAGSGTGLRLDPFGVSFTGFEWAVPVLTLTVPGILIVIAVLLQSLIGLAWLPVTRRWLGGDRRRRQTTRA